MVRSVLVVSVPRPVATKGFWVQRWDSSSHGILDRKLLLGNSCNNTTFAFLQYR